MLNMLLVDTITIYNVIKTMSSIEVFLPSSLPLLGTVAILGYAVVVDIFGKC